MNKLIAVLFSFIVFIGIAPSRITAAPLALSQLSVLMGNAGKLNKQITEVQFVPWMLYRPQRTYAERPLYRPQYRYAARRHRKIVRRYYSPRRAHTQRRNYNQGNAGYSSKNNGGGYQSGYQVGRTHCVGGAKPWGEYGPLMCP